MTAELTFLGVGAGMGLLLIARALLRGETDLEAAMARYRSLEWPGSPRADAGSIDSVPLRGASPLRRLASRLTGLSTGANASSRVQDLAVTGRTLEQHGLTLAWSLLSGAGLPMILSSVLAALGLGIPLAIVIALTLAGAGGGILCATLELKSTARAARGRFLRALSIWLELVSLSQAGGMGLEGALQAASRVSSDPAFAAIARSLETAQQLGSSPWSGMARLGREIGVAELDELAASLELAGSEGARIRSSLSAKSNSLRRRQMADAQARANSTTERLFLPSIVMMLGFMVFLMFPAAASLSHVL